MPLGTTMRLGSVAWEHDASLESRGESGRRQPDTGIEVAPFDMVRTHASTYPRWAPFARLGGPISGVCLPTVPSPQLPSGDAGQLGGPARACGDGSWGRARRCSPPAASFCKLRPLLPEAWEATADFDPTVRAFEFLPPLLLKSLCDALRHPD